MVPRHGERERNHAEVDQPEDREREPDGSEAAAPDASEALDVVECLSGGEGPYAKGLEMTLMFTPVVALVAGLVLGRRRAGYAIAALTWYVALAAQTIYLAKPGATAFGGRSGNATIRWSVYWLVQPPILGLALAPLLVGALVRGRILRKFDSSHALHQPT